MYILLLGIYSACATLLVRVGTSAHGQLICTFARAEDVRPCALADAFAVGAGEGLQLYAGAHVQTGPDRTGPPVPSPGSPCN